MLTRAEDWLNMMWALKSFYLASGATIGCAFTTTAHCGRNSERPPGNTFRRRGSIDRAEADRLVLAQLEGFAKCREFRRTNVLAPKVFDFAAFLEGDRMLLFDSDLLFFKEPTALLRRIEDPAYRRNTFNADCGHAYTVRPEEVRERIGHELLPDINSGLGLIDRGSMRPDWCEEFLSLPGILDGHFWRIEQTLIALCSSRFGAELLPDEYTLHLGHGIGRRPFRHYVGVIRHLMYREGIAHLAKAML